MKLVRHGLLGAERPGLIDAAGRLRDLSAEIPDIAGWALGSPTLSRLRALDPAQLPLVPGSPRLGACVGGTGKLICIGLNYSDHAAEANMQLPSEPVVFMKATSAICGPTDDIEIPRGATKVDWEAELAVVIGSRAKYVSEDRALDHVAGYCVSNDVSERSFQLERQGQWTKGKSHDTFAPLGPWLVTADEIADPQRLSIWLEVNGHRYQNGTTANMVYTVRHLVSYLSQFMTLMPGDVISTGTPAGVGLGQKPPAFLKSGDRVRVGIEGLGIQEQSVRAAPPASEPVQVN